MGKSAVEKEYRKRWKEIPRKKPGEWAKGKTVEGIYRGYKDPAAKGQSGVIIIEIDGNNSRFWCPTILADIVSDIHEGDEIRIECLGKSAKTARGMAWDFTVSTFDGGGE